jgi:Flp pilus assembly protein TadD
MPRPFLFYTAFFFVFLLLSTQSPAFAQNATMADTVAQGADKKASESFSGNFLSSYYALTQGDTSSARRYLEQMTKDDPTNMELRSRLLLMQITDGDMSEAIETAKTLKSKDGHELIVDLLLAAEQTRAMKYSDALETINKVNVPQFNAVWLPLMREWLSHPEGSAPKAATLKTLFPKQKNPPSFLVYHVGLLNEFNGYAQESAKLYASSISRIERAPFRAMQAYIQQRAREDDRKALTAFIDKLKQQRPDTLELLVNRYPYLTHLDSPEALPPEFLASNPKEGFAEILFTMASLLYAVDSTQDVVLYLRMALHLRPDFPTAQLMLANVLEVGGHPEKALPIYSQIQPENPLYVATNIRKAYLLDSLKRSDEALALLDKVAKLAPNSLETIVARGDILRTQRKYSEAIAQYTDAISRINTVDASHWGAFFARGACYERLNDFAHAEADLKQAMKLAPNQPEVLNYLGYMWLSNGEHKDRAFQLIERAYTLAPNQPHIVDSYGWAHYLTGKLDRAVELLEEATTLDPNEPTVSEHLGDAYWQLDRKNEAQFKWQQALEHSTDEEQQTALKAKLKDGLKPYPFAITHSEPSARETKDLVYE